ncbi:hypothetical protein V1522DRAFT_118026 [Lipomyces starkeyi]
MHVDLQALAYLVQRMRGGERVWDMCTLLFRIGLFLSPLPLHSPAQLSRSSILRVILCLPSTFSIRPAIIQRLSFWMEVITVIYRHKTHNTELKCGKCGSAGDPAFKKLSVTAVAGCGKRKFNQVAGEACAWLWLGQSSSYELACGFFPPPPPPSPGLAAHRVALSISHSKSDRVVFNCTHPTSPPHHSLPAQFVEAPCRRSSA